MSKPDDIPQDAWDKASSCEEIYRQTGSFDLMQDAIARALMTAKAEAYEDAAKMAEARIELFTRYGNGLTGRNALKEAANSIRSKANCISKAKHLR